MHEMSGAKRWGQAASEVRDQVIVAASDGVNAAGRLGSQTLERAVEAVQSVDLNRDSVPDGLRAAAAAGQAGAAIKGAASGVADAFGSLFKRKHADGASPEGEEPGKAVGPT